MPETNHQDCDNHELMSDTPKRITRISRHVKVQVFQAAAWGDVGILNWYGRDVAIVAYDRVRIALQVNDLIYHVRSLGILSFTPPLDAVRVPHCRSSRSGKCLIIPIA